MKLDRLIARHHFLGRKMARTAIEAGRVFLNHQPHHNPLTEISRFDTVTLDDEILQQGSRRLTLMMHKAAGDLSATTDPIHPTVIDRIDDPDRESLHLVGRLDRASTGLLLLTNDGRWSKRIMHPDHKLPKTYLVHTANPIEPSAREHFLKGLWFAREQAYTLPADLEILEPHSALVTLVEGRHHQIKRMFLQLHNRVTALHRRSIGALTLPDDLPPGAWRPLSPSEETLALTSRYAAI